MEHPGPGAASEPVTERDLDRARARYGSEDAVCEVPEGVPDGEAPPPPPPRKVSLLPALLVVGLAVIIVLGFTLLGALGSSKAPTPKASATRGPVPGTGLSAEPAARALSPVLTPGAPPSNIVASVTVPTTARRTSSQPTSETSGQYDATVCFHVPRASQGAVVEFYRKELSRLGWKIMSVGTTLGGDGIQIVGQKAGSDDWYWEAGIVVSPTTFGAAAPGGAQPSTAASSTGDQTTPFSLELFQESDGD